jgi:hypothetical protein
MHFRGCLLLREYRADRYRNIKIEFRDGIRPPLHAVEGYADLIQKQEFPVLPLKVELDKSDVLPFSDAACVRDHVPSSAKSGHALHQDIKTPKLFIRKVVIGKAPQRLSLGLEVWKRCPHNACPELIRRVEEGKVEV